MIQSGAQFALLASDWFDYPLNINADIIVKNIMAVQKDKLEELLKQLPEDLQNQVLSFAQSLVRSKNAGHADLSGNGHSPVRSLFGIRHSGNAQSSDNDLIDADVARAYVS